MNCTPAAMAAGSPAARATSWSVWMFFSPTGSDSTDSSRGPTRGAGPGAGAASAAPRRPAGAEEGDMGDPKPLTGVDRLADVELGLSEPDAVASQNADRRQPLAATLRGRGLGGGPEVTLRALLRDGVLDAPHVRPDGEL